MNSFVHKLFAIFLFMLFAAIGSASDPHRPPPLGKLIDVGGYRVHLYCTGTGSPTVIVAGGGFSFDWGLVQPQVAKFTRICTYDPSGTAWSDPFPALSDGNKGSAPPQRVPACSERVEELHKLLKNASIQGPYVVVGFSIGGLYGRLYAHNYPEDAAGMVIVDHAFIDAGSESQDRSQAPTSETPLSAAHLDSPPVLISKEPIALGVEDDQNFKKLPRMDQDLDLWAMSAHPVRPTSAAAAECFASIDKATQKDQYPLRDMPLVVISTTYDSPNYRKLQSSLLSLSRDSRQMVAENSSHMVIIDNPGVIVSAIRQVVNAVRDHRRLQN